MAKYNIYMKQSQNREREGVGAEETQRPGLLNKWSLIFMESGRKGSSAPSYKEEVASRSKGPIRNSKSDMNYRFRDNEKETDGT